jgi:hypothetical protein
MTQILKGQKPRLLMVINRNAEKAKVKGTLIVYKEEN